MQGGIEIVNEKNLIPRVSLIERNLPIKEISNLAKKEGNGKKPVYEMHKWWARRLSAVVRSMLIGALLPSEATNEEFWEMFYSNNSSKYTEGTVMDIFMGGGTSLVEAKKMGFNTIGYDIDPLACFVTKMELEECDVEVFEKEFKNIEVSVGTKIRELYVTEVQGEKYPIINVFWVYQVACEKCGTEFEAHPHYQLYYNEDEQYVFCKYCGNLEKIASGKKEFQCSNCNQITEIFEGNYKRGYCTCPNCKDKFKLPDKVNGLESLNMFAIEYVKDNTKFFKQVDNQDVELYNRACELFEESNLEKYIPMSQIPNDNRTDVRPISHGYKYYRDLFNGRQLLSLALLLQEILKTNNKSLQDWFLISFSDCLSSNNMLCNYAYGYRKLTPLFGIHAYTVPVRPVENNVWGSGSFGRGTFERTVKKVIKAKKYCDSTYENGFTKKGNIKKIYTKESIASRVTNNAEQFYNGQADSLILNTSSEELKEIIDNSVDIILTDPPYYDNIHYSELADFYYQWIKQYITSNGTQPIKDALFVSDNEANNKTNYQMRLTRIFSESYKKLKANGIMLFSYHHNKEEAWTALGNAIKESNFIVSNVLPIRSEGQSAYHSSDNSIKWDSIIILRKKEIYQLTHVNTVPETIDNLLIKWETNIKEQELDMKACDKLSFYRSLSVMAYSQAQNDKKLEEFYGAVN